MMAATKHVFQEKPRLAVREQLFLRCHRTVRRLFATISPQDRAILTLRLLTKHRHKTQAQR
jgi:hypothetical protein